MTKVRVEKIRIAIFVSVRIMNLGVGNVIVLLMMQLHDSRLMADHRVSLDLMLFRVLIALSTTGVDSRFVLLVLEASEIRKHADRR